MKNLFIIGASILQLPAIQKAKEMGLRVGVADRNPEAVGISYADTFFNVSTIDEEGIYQAAKSFGADGIMTLATDMPMRSLAYACERLGLIGIPYATAIRATDKGEMIKAFERFGVAHPWYYIAENQVDAERICGRATFPCVIKPTDSSGSRGVVLAHNKSEFSKAVLYSSENGHSGSVIVEEYLTGQEVSVEIIVYKGDVHILQITDKQTTGAPYFVETGHIEPTRLSADKKMAVCDLACRAVHAIGIENGAAHVEIMVTENGPKMIELGARMAGDCIATHLVPLSTGIDMVKASIDMSLGREPDLTPKFEKGSAIRFLCAPVGVIEAIDGTQEAERTDGVRLVSYVKKAGDMSVEIKNSTDRIGYVIAQGMCGSGAARACEEAKEKIHISISGGNS